MTEMFCMSLGLLLPPALNMSCVGMHGDCFSVTYDMSPCHTGKPCHIVGIAQYHHHRHVDTMKSSVMWLLTNWTSFVSFRTGCYTQLAVTDRSPLTSSICKFYYIYLYTINT